MQHDLFGSGHDLDLRSNFQNDLLMSDYSSFDASQEGKYDAGKMNGVSLLSQKVLQKSLFSEKRLLLEFLLSDEGQTVGLRSNLRTIKRKSVKRAIECAFPERCSSSGSGVMRRFAEKCFSVITFGSRKALHSFCNIAFPSSRSVG